MTLDEQIAWVEKSRRHMARYHPEQITEGRLTQERASYLQAVAQATFETLSQLRGLATRGGPIAPASAHPAPAPP